MEALERAGIRTVLLKGAALLDAYGGDWGARPMYDVDVLVPIDDAEAAIELVAARGWEPEQRQSAGWVRWRARPRRQGWGFTDGDGRLDLHWHVLSESIGERLPTIASGRGPGRSSSQARTRALDPADLLVHLLVHGTVTFNAPAVQWVADSVMVLRQQCDDDSFVARVAESAREQAEQRSVTRALDAIGLLIDRELVAEVLTQLEQRRPTLVSSSVDPAHGGSRRDSWRDMRREAKALRAGALELSAERLDLGLTTHRAADVVLRRQPAVAGRRRPLARSDRQLRAHARRQPRAAAGVRDRARLLTCGRARPLRRHRVGPHRRPRRHHAAGGERGWCCRSAPTSPTATLDVVVDLEPLDGDVDLVVLAN